MLPSQPDEKRHTINPIVKVNSPSIRNSQNHPVLPRTPRICRIPAASNEEIIRATSFHQHYRLTARELGGLTFNVDQKKDSRTDNSPVL